MPLSALDARTVKREGGALRIPRLHDPTSARHLLRTMHDRASAFADAPGRGVDVLDVEIKQPEAPMLCRRTIEHPTDRHISYGEQLIGAHGPHVHGVTLAPAKHRVIELERIRPIGGVQFVPSDLSGCA